MRISSDADPGWETMLIQLDSERVPSAGVVTGSPDAGREMMLIPPDWEGVLGSGVTVGVIDDAWETMSVPPDRAHIPGDGFRAVPLALTARRFRSRQTANACLVPAMMPVTLSLCGFTLTMIFWSRYVSSKTGAGCDVS